MLTKGLFGGGLVGAMSQLSLNNFNIANTTAGFYPMPFTEVGSKPGITISTNSWVGSSKVFALSNTGTYKLRVYNGSATLDTGTEERTASFDFRYYDQYTVSNNTQIIYTDSTLFDSAGPIALSNFNKNFYHNNNNYRYVFGVSHTQATTANLSTAGWYLQLDYLSPNDIT